MDLTGDGEDAKHWVEEHNYDLAILNSISDAGVPTPTVVAPEATPPATAPQ